MQKLEGCWTKTIRSVPSLVDPLLWKVLDSRLELFRAQIAPYAGESRLSAALICPHIDAKHHLSIFKLGEMGLL